MEIVGKHVQIDFEYKFEVVNLSNQKMPFRQRLEFLKPEKPKLKSVSGFGI